MQYTEKKIVLFQCTIFFQIETEIQYMYIFASDELQFDNFWSSDGYIREATEQHLSLQIILDIIESTLKQRILGACFWRNGQDVCVWLL